MGERYDEIMEHIQITPEMRQRILGNLQKMELKPEAGKRVIPLPRRRQLMGLAACLALIFLGALALPGLLPAQPVETPPSSTPPIMLGNSGIKEVSSIDELARAVGFEVLEVEGLPFRVEETTYTSHRNGMAQIKYRGEEQSATYRKGSGDQDVSGDHTVYPQEAQISVGAVTVTLKGDGSGYTLAVWSDGEYSYSLSLSRELDEDAWTMLLGQWAS